MTTKTCLFFYFSCLAFLSIAIAEERAPHGLAHENPTAFSPSAFEFFHPKAQDPETKNPCTASNCSPLPMAAHVEANQAQESKIKNGGRIGAGAIACVVFGLAFAVLLAMGVYYVLITRRTNMTRANSVQPDA